MSMFFNRQRVRGFTLIEMLTVIVIIGILAALISTAIIKAKHHATRMKDNIGAVAIENAIKTYRFEYQKWPCEESYRPSAARPNNVTYKTTNYKVIHGFLDNNAPANFKKITYLNKADFKFDAQSNVVNYMSVPYKIFIDFANDTCSVQYKDDDGNWQSGGL